MDENSLEYKNAINNIKIKLNIFNKAHEIAHYNRKHFWSNKFYDFLLNEAIQNLNKAKIELASKRV